jgi:hypothetical protein
LSEIPQPLVQVTPDGFQLSYDILGLTYWMLARCEEVNPPAELLDNHGRFPATSSHALRHRYLDRPIVDEWLGMLRQLVQRLWPRLPLQHHQFRIVVSHDVDAPTAYGIGSKNVFIRNVGSLLLKQHNVSEALLALRVRLTSRGHLHNRDPFNTFEWLMDQSDSLGERSTFYFMSCFVKTPFDAQYNLGQDMIRALMRSIHRRGHCIGLHPSYNAYNNQSVLAHESQLFRSITAEEVFIKTIGEDACIICVGSGQQPHTPVSKQAWITTPH